PSNLLPLSQTRFRRRQPAEPLHSPVVFARPVAAPRPSTRSTARFPSPPLRTKGDSISPARRSCLGPAIAKAEMFEKLGHKIARHRRPVFRRGSNIIDRLDLRSRGLLCHY